MQLVSKYSFPGFRMFMVGSCGIGCSVSYMIFSALRGLTVGLKLAAHVAVWKSSDIEIYN